MASAESSSSHWKPLTTISILFALTLSVGCVRAGRPASRPNLREPSHGTINVFLANQNGIIALTDSRLTYENGKPVPEPAQKLFELDSKSVAAFAGFASQTLPMDPEVTNATADVIQSYALSLQNEQYNPTLATKLGELTFILRSQLELIAAIAKDVPQGRTFDIELTVAGFDNDGIAKIESVDMGLTHASPFYIVSVGEPHEIIVQKNLAYCLRGVKDYARRVLENPQTYASKEPVVAKYAESRKTGGSDLTLNELQDLALFAAQETAKNTPVVAAPYELAVLKAGKVASLELPAIRRLSPGSRPPFLLVWENTYDYPSPKYPISAAPPRTLLFVNNIVRGVAVILDGGYFYGNVFTNCVLKYDGGKTKFVGGGNDVTHATLLLGRHAHTNPIAVEELRKLQWASIEEE
jgi:20S proteasome alpha/beta subunit